MPIPSSSQTIAEYQAEFSALVKKFMFYDEQARQALFHMREIDEQLDALRQKMASLLPILRGETGDEQ